MGEEEKMREELQTLQKEHGQINEKITSAGDKGSFDQLLLQRMKRRKLQLKDRISFLQGFLCDDIIA